MSFTLGRKASALFAGWDIFGGDALAVQYVSTGYKTIGSKVGFRKQDMGSVQSVLESQFCNPLSGQP